VEGVDRAGWEAVHDVTEPAHVVELQVGRVVEIDVRLRDAVDREEPGVCVVGVAQQLRDAEAHGVSPGFRAVLPGDALAR